MHLRKNIWINNEMKEQEITIETKLFYNLKLLTVPQLNRVYLKPILCTWTFYSVSSKFKLPTWLTIYIRVLFPSYIVFPSRYLLPLTLVFICFIHVIIFFGPHITWSVHSMSYLFLSIILFNWYNHHPLKEECLSSHSHLSNTKLILHL